jgi:membrane glycosyltransferase
MRVVLLGALFGWLGAIGLIVTAMLFADLLSRRRERMREGRAVKAAQRDTTEIPPLSDEAHDKIVAEINVMEPLSAEDQAELDDFFNFEDDVESAEMRTAFQTWVQIHSDAHQCSDAEVSRRRDEWLGEAA